jgi:hypothetical protein
MKRNEFAPQHANLASAISLNARMLCFARRVFCSAKREVRYLTLRRLQQTFVFLCSVSPFLFFHASTHHQPSRVARRF